MNLDEGGNQLYPASNPASAPSNPASDAGGRDIAEWTKIAIKVSWLSIVLTLGTGITGIVIFAISSSSAMLAYSLESFVDVFSSIVVVWRFSLDLDECKNDGFEHSQAVLIHSAEKRAGVLIAFNFVVISIVVPIQAALHLHNKSHPEDDIWLIVFSGCSFAALFLLGIAKFYISKKLESSAMTKDAYCSFAVAIISLSMAISIVIYRSNDDIWFLDATIALIVCAVLLVYGLRTLLCYGHQWWKGAFWTTDTIAKKHFSIPPADDEHSDDELPSEPQPMAVGRGDDVDNGRIVDEEAPLLNSDSKHPSTSRRPLASAQDQQTVLENNNNKSECRCTIS